MSRIAKLILAILGLLVLVPAILVVIALSVGNTERGRHLIERWANDVGAGQFDVTGLSGRFPDALHVDRLDLRDAAGVWATAENVSLDWSPLYLLVGEARIDRVAAATIALLRKPQPSTEGSGHALWLPVRVDLSALRIDRLDISASIAGAPAALSVRADGRIDGPTRMEGSLIAERLDAPGQYRVDATLDEGRLSTRASAEEPAQGLIAELAGLPDLGPLSLMANIEGPRSAEATVITVSAGPLRAKVQGDIDLAGESADLSIAITAPAMQPAADISWQSADVQARLQGRFDRPSLEGRIDLEKAAVGTATFDSLAATVQGSGGAIGLSASLAGLHGPGPAGALFETTPIAITAGMHLDSPDRPFQFKVAHPLLTVTGDGTAGATRHVTAAIDLPALGQIATAFGIAMQGHASLDANLSEADGATTVTLGGTIAVLDGVKPIPALLGRATRLDLAATVRGQDVQIQHAAVDGAALHVTAQGDWAQGALALGWTLSLPNLAVLDPGIAGSFSAQGRLTGPLDRLMLATSAQTAPTVGGVSLGSIQLSLDGQGNLTAPSASLDMRGKFAGAPLLLSASLEPHREGGFDLSIANLRWKSVTAKGSAVLLPTASLPEGGIDLKIGRLADLSSLVALNIDGSLAGTIGTNGSRGGSQAKLALTATKLALGNASIDTVRLDGTVDDLLKRPTVSLRLVGTGIAAESVTGTATLSGSGPVDATTLHVAADLQRDGIAAQIAATATLDASRRTLELTRFNAQSKGAALHLLDRAHFDFAKGASVDHLRVGSDRTVFEVAGSVTPRLALTASLRDLTPAVAKPFLPGVAAFGTLDAQAAFSGTLSAPTGSIRITGRGLQLQSAVAGGIAPVSLDARGVLADGEVRVDVRLNSGHSVNLSVAGLVPLNTARAIDLTANGTLDLAVLDPVLSAAGRRVEGQLTLDAAVAGHLDAPRVSGTATVAKGEFQDFTLGLRLAGITARLQGDGNSVRLVKLEGKAGQGTISASGTVQPLETDMPVSLEITARNAQPLSSDLLTATLDADMTLQGKAAERLTLGGQVHVHRANIAIPESFPPTVATLNVQARGAPMPAPTPPRLVIGLDLSVTAPEQVFVRGRGLDAEMGGRLQIAGTTATPVLSGGFNLRHGTFNLGSATLNFSSGLVSFGGTGLVRRLDPSLNFVAMSATATATITLTITGYADAPKIAISSVPSLPQDEALAQLLFGQSVKQLSPFQLAEIANAVAALTGTGGGFDPLGSLRKTLGLDRLSAGSSGSGASVQAGKYIANGVYVGAQQGVSGGTRAQVQIDLTKHLKLDTVIGVGVAAPSTTITPDNDPGSSIGLTYEFDY